MKPLTLCRYFMVVIWSASLLYFSSANAGSVATQAAAKNAPESLSRIVSLAPAVTEILFAMGAGDSVVGVSAFSDFPAEAVTKPSIGDYSRPNIEKILALQPNIVIGLREGTDTYSGSLSKLKSKILLLDLRTLDDYQKSVLTIGEAIGHRAEAAKLVQIWTTSWNAIKKSTSSARVLIQVDESPLLIAGRGTFLHEIVEKCGHTNVGSSRAGYTQLQAEVLATKRPEIVLVTVHGEGLAREAASNYWRTQKLFPTPKVILANPNDLSRLGPRLPDAAMKLCSSLEAVINE